MPDLSNKSVIVTGASRGIGAAAARAFVEAGARVALLARSEEAIADLTAELGPDRTLAIPCDVSRPWEIEQAVQATVAAFGGLDVLVNNAGVIEPISAMADSDPTAWGHVIDVNLKGVYLGMRAAMGVMIPAGGGTILTVSSGAASRPLEGWSHYCVSKAGVKMLTECVDLEARAQGIRAIGLSPGTVATEMQVQIRDSGVNPVSQLDWSDHIPPDWPGRTLAWLATAEADDLVGTEVSLRDMEIRRRVGLVE